MKHEKAPTAPRFEGVMTISYIPMFWKITAFGHFWPTSGSRKCQKTHLHTKTIHLNLFPGLYDRSLGKYSLESSCFEKHGHFVFVFGHFGQIRPFPVAEYGKNCQKADLQVKTFHMSFLPGLYDHPLQRNSLEKPMFR